MESKDWRKYYEDEECRIEDEYQREMAAIDEEFRKAKEKIQLEFAAQKDAVIKQFGANNAQKGSTNESQSINAVCSPSVCTTSGRKAKDQRQVSIRQPDVQLRQTANEQNNSEGKKMISL